MSVDFVTRKRAVPRFVNHTPGFDEDEERIVPEDKIVGVWGVVDDEGRNILMGWKVSGIRLFKGIGAVERPAPSTRYGQSLFESMFKGW